MDRQADERAPRGPEQPQARREGRGLRRGARALAGDPGRRAQRARQLAVLLRGAPGAEGQLGGLEVAGGLPARRRASSSRVSSVLRPLRGPCRVVVDGGTGTVAQRRVLPGFRDRAGPLGQTPTGSTNSLGFCLKLRQTARSSGYTW